MDTEFLDQIRDSLPADLIYSLAYAGIVNKETFLAISLNNEDDCINQIRISDIESYIQQLARYLSPSDLRRFLPIWFPTASDSDNSIANYIGNWSLPPGYKYIILRVQNEIRSTANAVECVEPSAKRRRLSNFQNFDISQPDVSMLDMPPRPSLPAMLQAPKLEAPTPSAIETSEQCLDRPIDLQQPSIDLHQPSVDPQQLSVDLHHPSLDLQHPSIVPPKEESKSTVVLDNSPNKRRNRRRGKRTHGRRKRSPEVIINSSIEKCTASTPRENVDTEKESKSFSTTNKGNNKTRSSVGGHFIFDSDGEVVEDRVVEVEKRTCDVAQNRKSCKQRPNFPEMPKSAQLKSRQSNTSFVFTNGLENTSQLNTPAFKLQKRKKPVVKVDIDSTSSSSSSSSSSEDEEENKEEKGTIEKPRELSSKVDQHEEDKKPSEDAIPRNYEEFPTIKKPPEPGSRFCFRILELNPSSLMPGVSEYKEGILLSYDLHRDRCTIEVVANKRKCEGSGKFDVRIESEDGILTNFEEEESTLIACWSALQEPRLIKSKETN